MAIAHIFTDHTYYYYFVYFRLYEALSVNINTAYTRLIIPVINLFHNTEPEPEKRVNPFKEWPAIITINVPTSMAHKYLNSGATRKDVIGLPTWVDNETSISTSDGFMLFASCDKYNPEYGKK